VVGAVGVAAGGAVPAGRGDDALVDVLVAESARVADGAGAGKVEEVGGRRALGPVKAPRGRRG
jgi:hypothetical protein